MKSVPPGDHEFRIIQRTYSGDAGPLVDVLVMIHDWSVERRQRLASESEREHGPDREDVR